MAGEGKSTIMIAAISAISAIVIALITTYGTIAVSAPEAEKVKDDFEAKVDSVRNQFEEFLNLQPIENLPVGTIVPSMLNPSEFADEVGDPTNFDRKESKWVLADGQNNITNSRYAELRKVDYTPDLRGMFLRGMNEKRDDGKQDPQKDRNAGDYQADAFAKHKHLCPVGYYDQEFTPLKGGKDFMTGIKPDPNKKDHKKYRDRRDSTGDMGSEETRPKNVAVYYYIKIN